MATGRRLTIKEVARAAGVSTQTVSRVLNNRPDVAPETLERVQQVIDDTGYSPNLLARGLIRGRSQILGVVAYGLDYFGPSRVLTGIDQQAAETGYSISLNLVHEPETEDVNRLLSGLVSRQVEGIIWAIPQISNNRVWSSSKVAQLPVPVLLVGGMDGSTSLPSIGIDNHAIGRTATEHLILGGARHIGIVTGPLDWWEARQREQGWRDTLEAYGLETSPGRVAIGDWGPTSGEDALYELLEQEPRIDAIFASNDQMALGVLHAAHSLGLRVPDDISIVGVDNIAESSHFWPSLTTVDQPLRDAGALAVRDIDEAIRRSRHSTNGADALAAQTTLLQPKLIVRDSSRAVGADPGR